MDLASFYISGGAIYELESIFECQENWRFRNLQCFMRESLSHIQGIKYKVTFASLWLLCFYY